MNKACTTCKETKSLDCFGVEKRAVDGLRSSCKECRKIESKKYYANNTEAQLANMKVYRDTVLAKGTEGHERVRARQIAARAKNPEPFRQSNRKYVEKYPERDKASKDKWRANNQASIKARSIARKKKVKQSTPLWADMDYMNDLYSNCREFEKILSDVGINQKFQVDHIVPLTSDVVCGLHNEFNLQVLTAKENRLKSNSFTTL